MSQIADMWDACVLICCFFHLAGKISTHTWLCIPSEFRRIPTEVGQKSLAGTEWSRNKHRNVPTLAARGLEEHVWITLIHQFHVIYCATLAYVLFPKNFWFTIHVVDSWFWRIIDRICWIPNLQVTTSQRASTVYFAGTKIIPVTKESSGFT